MPHWQLRNEPYSPEMAVKELDGNWGDLYDIWVHVEFSARRVDGTGQALTATHPGELHAAISADRELAGDGLTQAVLRAYEARGIEIGWAQWWLAIIREETGRTVISRHDLPALLAALRELHAAGVLPG